MLKELEQCKICPHKCNINRNIGQYGKCKASKNIKIALYSIHDFEEPCISGNKGSGTIFFSNCTMKCIYCQNYEISQERKRKRNINRGIGRYFYQTTGKRSRKYKSSNPYKLYNSDNRGNKNSKAKRIKNSYSI